MGINLFFTALVILACFSFLAVSDRAESLDITKVIQGTVKEIKAGSIGILDDTSVIETRIGINSNTVYDGVQKLADLKEGDKVQIEYHEDHRKSVASLITKIEVEGGDNA